MNNQQRRQARYERRVRARAEKLEARRKQYSFEAVFSFGHLWKSYKLCCKGVGWKASTQKFRNKPLSNVARLYNAIKAQKFRSRGFYEFDRCERGKLRHIKSVHISERVVQRCQCDYALIPLFRPTLIYDNAASLKGRGIDFAKDRLERQLKTYYRKYGAKGYALMYDFKSYFENVSHEKLFEIADKTIPDKKILALYKYLIKMFGEKGIGLGSQVSQISAVKYPDCIDKAATQKWAVLGYGRYMDDGYIIHNSKIYLRHCLDLLKNECRQSKIILNAKKTEIVSLSNGMVYLKHRFILTETGKVLRIPQKDSYRRHIRKLKSFSRKIEAGEMPLEAAVDSHISWRSHLLRSHAHKQIANADKQFGAILKRNGGILKNGTCVSTPVPGRKRG